MSLISNQVTRSLWRPSHLSNFQCPPPFQHLPVIQGLSRPATISKVHHFPRSLTLPKSTTISKVHHYYHHNQGPPTITKVHHHIPSPPPLLYLWSTTISSTTTNSKAPHSQDPQWPILTVKAYYQTDRNGKHFWSETIMRSKWISQILLSLLSF